MRDLGEIVRVNAQAMRNADKYGMGRRPDPHKTHGDGTSARISARERLIQAALGYTGDAPIGAAAALFAAADEYRKVHNI